MPTWNHTYIDGDYCYSRETFRMLYDAFLEREKCTSVMGAAWEESTGDDPVDDEHAYIAVTGGAFGTFGWVPFGSLHWLHSAWNSVWADSESGSPSSSNFYCFADPTVEVNATDNADGSDFDATLTRTKMEAAIGAFKRTCPRKIATPEATEDQFGNEAVAGQLAYSTVGAPWHATVRQRVYECIAPGEWELVSPQQSARPDILDSTAGEIEPYYESYMLDEEGNVLIDDETGEPYEPIHRDGFYAGDYMGIHLWQQTQDAYNMLGVIFRAGNYGHDFALVGSGSWTPVANAEPGYVLDFCDWNLSGSIFGGTDPAYDHNTFAEVKAAAEAEWDGRDPELFTPWYNGPFAYSISQTFPDDTDTTWVVDLYGGEAEVAWKGYRQHRAASLKFYSFVEKQNYANEDTTVFDAFSTGFVESQWRLMSEMTGPEDRNPANTLTHVMTGDVYGGIDPGEYPDVDEAAMDTIVTRGWKIGRTSDGIESPPGSGIYIPHGGNAAIIDYRVGFDYAP